MHDRPDPRIAGRASRIAVRAPRRGPTERTRSTEGSSRAVGVCARTVVRGFTLIELLMVLGVMVTLACLVLPRVSEILDGPDWDAAGGAAPGDPKSSGTHRLITQASMIAIRSAIVGTPEMAGFMTDLGQAPLHLEDLFNETGTLPSGAPYAASTDPALPRVWRGPYIERSTGTYHVNAADDARFYATYGTDGGRALLDAWRQPIVLQWPDADPAHSLAQRQQNIRLVSAGPNGVIDTPSSVQDRALLQDRNVVRDDVVLPLF